jgi:hypothetical protein
MFAATAAGAGSKSSLHPSMNAEPKRRAEAHQPETPWKQWGPYLSERRRCAEFLQPRSRAVARISLG